MSPEPGPSRKWITYVGVRGEHTNDLVDALVHMERIHLPLSGGHFIAIFVFLEESPNKGMKKSMRQHKLLGRYGVEIDQIACTVHLLQFVGGDLVDFRRLAQEGLVNLTLTHVLVLEFGMNVLIAIYLCLILIAYNKPLHDSSF